MEIDRCIRRERKLKIKLQNLEKKGEKERLI